MRCVALGPRSAVLGLLLLAGLVASVRDGRGVGAQTPPLLQWYKGNTHTHTLNSDGDTTPDDVVRWYREHGYRFLVLSDHNFLTSVDGLNAVHGADELFLVIKGEEVSDRADAKPIHINGLDVSTRVEPQHGSSVVDVVQRNVDAIRKAGGIPHVNHPNFEWAISRRRIERIERTRLFELYNGHHLVNNLGGGGIPGMEEVWDRLLSSGGDLRHRRRRCACVQAAGESGCRGAGTGWVSSGPNGSRRGRLWKRSSAATSIRPPASSSPTTR